MTQELIYTSAPRGLKPGARGFCTVACTQGMSKPLAEQLEALSGYRPIYPAGDERAGDNPVNYSHSILRISGNEYHVLSRVADAGFDYTQRSNKLAHHVVLGERELTACGPAALLAAPGFMVQSWAGEPQLITAGRPAREAPVPADKCVAWERATGDAGWGGVLAETALTAGTEPVVVIYRTGFDPLPLVNEALSLLSMSARWKTTFSTYYTKGAGIDCRWRFMVDGTAEAKLARRTPNARLIDLCGPQQPAEGGELVQAARTGSRPATPSSEDSARRRQERLVQFGTAAATTSTQAASTTDDAVYGIAIPDVPPLGDPSVRVNARQRAVAATRRRRKYTFGVIAAVSLLLVAGMGTAVYWSKNQGDIQSPQPNHSQDGSAHQSPPNESMRGGGDETATPSSSPEQVAVTASTATVDERDKESLTAEENGDQGTQPNVTADEGKEPQDEVVAVTPSTTSSGESTDQPTSEQKPVFRHLRDKHFQLQLPVISADSFSESQKLAVLKFPAETDVTLTLVGVETAMNSVPLGRPNVLSFRVETPSQGNLKLVRIATGQNDLDVAHFSVKGKTLAFRWGTSKPNDTDRLAAAYLRNCVLAIECGGQKTSMQLQESRPLAFGKLVTTEDDSRVQCAIGSIEMSNEQIKSLFHNLIFKPVSDESKVRNPEEVQFKKSGDGIHSPLKLSFPVHCDSSLGDELLILETWLKLEELDPKSPQSPHQLFLNATVKGPAWNGDPLKREREEQNYSLTFLEQRIASATKVIESNPEKKSAEYIQRLRDIRAFCEIAKTFISNLKDPAWCDSNVFVTVEAKADDIPIRLLTLGNPDLEPLDSSVEKDAEP